MPSSALPSQYLVSQGHTLVVQVYSPQTPAAVIQQGTVEGQRCLKAPLSDIASMAVDQGFRSPSIVLIGEVINHEVPSCAPRPAAVTMPIPF